MTACRSHWHTAGTHTHCTGTHTAWTNTAGCRINTVGVVDSSTYTVTAPLPLRKVMGFVTSLSQAVLPESCPPHTHIHTVASGDPTAIQSNHVTAEGIMFQSQQHQSRLVMEEALQQPGACLNRGPPQYAGLFLCLNSGSQSMVTCMCKRCDKNLTVQLHQEPLKKLSNDRHGHTLVSSPPTSLSSH